MAHYFLVGNLWLLVAAVVYWGSRPAIAGNANDWTLFGIGRQFHANQYPLIIGALLAMAALCFVLHILHVRRARKDA